MKKYKNSNLNEAKIAKNDEFYTLLEDIEKELSNYKDYFLDKTIYLNCDDPKSSNFYLYFSKNFKDLGLKKLICTFHSKNEKVYKTELIKDGDGYITITKDLEGDGDFTSEECIQLLKESDIVVTNPPFSLFRKFFDVLIKNDKKFLVIGNMNAAMYKDIIPSFINNNVFFGINRVINFKIPKHHILKQKNAIKLENVEHIVKFGSVVWFTNLKDKNLGKDVVLTERYYGNEDRYPKYDSYNAINIDRLKDIPYDYEGVMGVPITIFDKLNKGQFEVVGSIKDTRIRDIYKYARIGIKIK